MLPSMASTSQNIIEPCPLKRSIDMLSVDTLGAFGSWFPRTLETRYVNLAQIVVFKPEAVQVCLCWTCKNIVQRQYVNAFKGLLTHHDCRRPAILYLSSRIMASSILCHSSEYIILRIASSNLSLLLKRHGSSTSFRFEDQTMVELLGPLCFKHSFQIDLDGPYGELSAGYIGC